MGPRHSVKPENIFIDKVAINWVQEIKYLGITILSGNNFKVNLQQRKQQFFRAVNAILGKIANFSSPRVVITLVESHCMPILLYGLESIVLNKSMIRSIENAYSQIFSKIFHSFERNTIKQCLILHGTNDS